MMSKEIKQRIEILRFIMMVLVVFIHSHALPQIAGKVIEVPVGIELMKRLGSSMIASVAVPFLFLISAYLLYQKNFKWLDNLRKKWRTLIFPYVLINLLWIILFQLASLVLEGSIPDNYLVSDWKDFLDCFLCVGSRREPMYYPFWFLRELILLNIISSVILWCTREIPVIFMIVVTGLYIFEVPLWGISATGIFFFALGCMFAVYHIDVEKADTLSAVRLTVIYVIFSTVMLVTQNAFLSKLYILLSIIFWFRISREFLKRERVLYFFIQAAPFSFFIYEFHEYALAFGKKIFMAVLPQTTVIQIAEYILLPILIITACILAGNFMEKYLNRIYRILTGSRKRVL